MKGSKSNTKFSKRIANAFEEAHNAYLKINFREIYFEGMRNTQLLEVLLDTLYIYLVGLGKSYFKSVGLSYIPKQTKPFTINTYITRIQTFFPESEFKNEYKILKTAMEKRNNFIHSSFKIKKGNFYAIDLDIDQIHQNENAGKVLNEWNVSYGKAYPILIQWLIKVSEIQKLRRKHES